MNYYVYRIRNKENGKCYFGKGHGIDVDDAQQHLMIVIAVDVRVPNPIALDTSSFTIRGNEYALGSGGLFWDSGLFKC